MYTLLLTTLLLATPSVQPAQGYASAPLNADVVRRLGETDQPVKAWVFFRDKGMQSEAQRASALAALEASYPARAIERRRLRRTAPGLFDEADLAVAASYTQAVRELGAEIVVESSWLNAVSAWVESEEEARAIAALPCVASMRLVGRSVRNALPAPPAPAPKAATGFYGFTEAQLAQIDLTTLHAKGFTGAGVVIGVLDSGFRLDHDAFNQAGHNINVIAASDFVHGDANVGEEAGDATGQADHGTMVLSTIAGYFPNTFVGGAYDASFVLAKTEDIASETPVEEDYYVQGLQFIEAQGADVATSSLGYIDWYTQGQLDGQTAVTTKVVNTATANGLFCCTAAGNSGNDTDPLTSHLIAPADALEVITCGAVDATDLLVAFSSDGATADGRTKPEVLALGLSTLAISPADTTNYVTVSGTSLSTPLVASAVACLAGAHPTWSVSTLRNQLFTTARSIGLAQPDPLFAAGFGIVDALAADEHLDIAPLDPGLSGGTSLVHVSGATPGAAVWMIWGLAPGSVPVPGCTPLTVGIAAPQIFGALTADNSGAGDFSVPIPPGLAGLGIYMQLVELGSCRASNLELNVLM
jgi:subtilisin family serine protease